jgi:hypothetical protein
VASVACTASAPPAEDGTKSSSTGGAPVPEPTTSAAPTASPSSPVGAWSSPSCGDRKYARELSIAEGGTFTARDLVSPCPPGAACVWSGIVERSGKWVADGSRLTFTVESGADAKPGVPFVTELEIGAEVLVESVSGQRCEYRKR